MYYVYILRSTNYPQQTYIGSTSDLRKRLESHNSGTNKHTSKFKPWRIVWYAVFSSQQKAEAFEKYLKSASGIAFRRKRLVRSHFSEVRTYVFGSTNQGCKGVKGML